METLSDKILKLAVAAFVAAVAFFTVCMGIAMVGWAF